MGVHNPNFQSPCPVQGGQERLQFDSEGSIREVQPTNPASCLGLDHTAVIVTLVLLFQKGPDRQTAW